MEISPQSGEVNMREVRPSGSGFVCVSRDGPLSTVVFSHASSTAGVGCHGMNVAEATPICFSPNRSVPGSSGEGPKRGGQSITDSPILADPGMVLRHYVSPGRPAMADPSEEPLSGRGHNFSP